MSAILQIPTLELLGLWGELAFALDGTNGYGGDIAELYAYRFGCPSPAADQLDPESEAARLQAIERARTLHGLIALFCETYGAKAVIDGRPFGSWIAETAFVHRAHVRIIPKGPACAA
jgi:hypothetical protein